MAHPANISSADWGTASGGSLFCSCRKGTKRHVKGIPLGTPGSLTRCGSNRARLGLGRGAELFTNFLAIALILR